MKTIKQLIAELEILYAKHGDVPCLVWNHGQHEYTIPISQYISCVRVVTIECGRTVP